MGSSPRMRGAQRRQGIPDMEPGIIPADAGSTRVVGGCVCHCWDHPRGCGEHAFSAFRRVTLAGSSPRMRGARHHDTRGKDQDRIIPADAGSTVPCGLRSIRLWDHPRGCGEHIDVPLPLVGDEGSSPRMRGARRSQGEDLRASGIIPADAGSTRSCWTTRARAGDHPRGCGEHFFKNSFDCETVGSSPRMRGAHRQICGSSSIGGDHPRGCGEHCYG